MCFQCLLCFTQCMVECMSQMSLILVLVIIIFKRVTTVSNGNFLWHCLALIGCLSQSIDIHAFCIQLAMSLGQMKTLICNYVASTALSGIVFAFYLCFPYILFILLHYHVVYREFLWPRSIKLVQMLIFQVHIIRNSLYIKHSSHFCVFFTFLTKLVIS